MIDNPSHLENILILGLSETLNSHRNRVVSNLLTKAGRERHLCPKTLMRSLDGAIWQLVLSIEIIFTELELPNVACQPSGQVTEILHIIFIVVSHH